MCSFGGVFAIACSCGTEAPLVKGRGSVRKQTELPAYP
jgi:hypothetical protein